MFKIPDNKNIEINKELSINLSDSVYNSLLELSIKSLNNPKYEYATCLFGNYDDKKYDFTESIELLGDNSTCYEVSLSEEDEIEILDILDEETFNTIALIHTHPIYHEKPIFSTSDFLKLVEETSNYKNIIVLMGLINIKEDNSDITFIKYEDEQFIRINNISTENKTLLKEKYYNKLKGVQNDTNR